MLKDRLADPTADAACETLLVAHELGGTDLDRRLAALVEDRVIDVQGRKDARAKQAGVRFARRFVLHRAARHGARRHVDRQRPGRLRDAAGPDVVVVGIAAGRACWVWAGRLHARCPRRNGCSTNELAGWPPLVASHCCVGSTLLLAELRWFRRRPLVDRLAPLRARAGPRPSPGRGPVGRVVPRGDRPARPCGRRTGGPAVRRERGPRRPARPRPLAARRHRLPGAPAGWTVAGVVIAGVVAVGAGLSAIVALAFVLGGPAARLPRRRAAARHRLGPLAAADLPRAARRRRAARHAARRRLLARLGPVPTGRSGDGGVRRATCGG